MASVFHIGPSLSRQGGGIAPVVWQMAVECRAVGIEPTVVFLRDSDTDDDASKYEEIRWFAGDVSWPRRLGRSTQVRRYLVEHGDECDLVHSHGLWMYPGVEARLLSRRQNIPWILSPHGMLNPWIQTRSRLKKTVASLLYENKNLRTVDCLHSTAILEATNLRNQGLKNPIAVVGIGLDVSLYSPEYDEQELINKWPELRDKKRLLFVSRIHPKKGLLNLAKVWGDLSKKYPDWHLVIAGPDELNHKAKIAEAIQSVGAENSTTFTGPVHGKLKTGLFAGSDVFVLPTFSENFGIVVPESLASGVPVITTTGAPWDVLEEHKCGWWIDIGVDPLRDAMEQAMSMSDDERAEMGQRGRKLVEQKYTWTAIAEQMASVYKWLLGEQAKPDCVYLDGDEFT